MNIIVVNQFITESGAAPATNPFWRMEFSHGMPVPVLDATGDYDENAVDFSHGMPVPVLEATD